MHNVPEFIINRVLMYTLMVDKRIDKYSASQKFQVLKDSIQIYLSSLATGFVSDKSQDFKDFLEDRVGKVTFSKSFGVRIRPDSVRLFVNGKEILS